MILYVCIMKYGSFHHLNTVNLAVDFIDLQSSVMVNITHLVLSVLGIYKSETDLKLASL